jgi:hypothetical protein
MSSLTNDQYFGLSKLDKWYRKYQHQFIEISGVIGTGTWDLVQQFIELTDLDEREVMYLSYNQKQVLDLAFKKYHAYYINGIIYKYIRIVDFDTIPVVNRNSRELKYEWKKEVRSKIDSKYKLIVVFDSVLLNHQTVRDLSLFGLPIILIRDPMLLPAPDTYTFLRDANIELHDVHPEYAKSPIVYFAHKILNRERLNPGNYDTVSVVPKKQMNLYNLRSSDMNITITGSLRDQINHIYRDKILKRKDPTNIINERVIVSNTLYNQRLVNPDEKKVKIYLTKGLVGTISKINKHAVTTKYVPIDFKPECYHESFTDLILDRHHLNKMDIQSHQLIPDEVIQLDYAYALTADAARLNHWDKVTLIIDPNEYGDVDLQQRLLYTGITRAKKSLTIIF